MAGELLVELGHRSAQLSLLTGTIAVPDSILTLPDTKLTAGEEAP